MNIALILEMASDTAGERTALVCDGRSWTYGELITAARGAAELIRQSKAEYVALLDVSSEAAAIALFGAAIAGVPYCPLNYRQADVDLAALIHRVSPAIIIGDAARIGKLSGDDRNIILSREEFVNSSQAAGADAPSDSSEGGDEVAIQLFTSGTTAEPKAAILRHRNLLAYILGTVEFAAASEEDGVLVCVPPYHIAGISAILSSFYSLRRILLLPNFTPEGWLELASKERATNAFVVPTMLSRIIETLDQKADATTPALRALAYGGGKMPLETIRRALELFPETEFTNAYGLTETSSTIALLGPQEHRDAQAASDPDVQARLSSVGKPLPTIELEIRDEDGKPVPAGVSGEIYVRGDQVSGEYKGRSVLSADGWFPTRDAGWLDKEGYLFLTGRADDVIVRGGENISPGEIEDVLASHPAVADSCAVAVPSVEWGEGIGLALVVRSGQIAPDAEEVKGLVRSRLRSSRVPDEVRIVDQLPYNEMGKLLRREVKKLFAEAG